jgi:hypothetical protein
VAEKPIIFSGDSVRAILEGRKTQTRRLIKPQPSNCNYLQQMWGVSPPPDSAEFGEPYLWREVGPDYPDDGVDDRRCPYGIPCGRLWVREAWGFSAKVSTDGHERWLSEHDATYLVYRAGVEPAARWRSPIFMPRWASRLTLEVTEIRVQRLQEISEEDAEAEGAVPTGCTHPDCYPGSCASSRFRPEFAVGWDRLNRKRAPWEINPWVWAISFKRIEA